MTAVEHPVAREVRRPGRPRSHEADRAILDAAIEEYGEHGLGGLTVDAVAARAGVGKATIYRRYPSKADLVIAAAQAACDDTAQTFTGDLRHDVRAVVEHLQEIMTDPRVGRAARMLIADAPRDAQLERLHREFVRQKRKRTIAMLKDAVARGLLRAGTDCAIAADQLVGPLFYRFLVTGEPIDNRLLDTVVDDFLRAHAA
jgi:AcrR family transcriptional regulator